ncbi:MAG: hypothetical protein ABR607_12670 [Pyrinomonadaceae bacterium]
MRSIRPVHRARKFRILSVVTSALLAGILPVAARAQFLHPKIATNEVTVRKVVIMPAKVNVVRDSMKGPEGMAAESEELSARVEKMVTEVLANRKHITTLNASAPPDANTQGKYTVADMQVKFDELLPKVMKKRKDVKKGRFSMGDEVLNLNLDKSADAIVFIRGRGQKLTSGKKAFVLLVGGMPAYLVMQIGIVDAHTGDLLLYTDPVFAGDPTTAVDRLRKALEKGFQKLPNVNQ